MSERELKFRVYNEALGHACTCTIVNCTFSEGRCSKIRSSIDHFGRCYSARRGTSNIEDCEACGKIWGLLCFHAKYCATAIDGNCQVQQCNYLRKKMALKQRSDVLELQLAKEKLANDGNSVELEKAEWPVVQRMEAARLAKEEVMEMIKVYRSQKGMQT